MNPIAGIVRDRMVLLTIRILLIFLMAAAAIRLVLLMFGAKLDINVNVEI